MSKINFEEGFCIIINSQFWQHCWHESEVLIAGKSYVTFDALFEQLGKNIKIFLIFLENN